MDTEYKKYSLAAAVTGGVFAGIGIVGNLTTIAVLLCIRENKVPRNAFLVSLACADLVVSGVSLPSTVAGIVLGEEFFKVHHALCCILCILCAPGCLASVYSMCFIAASRYYYICDFPSYLRYFSRQKIGIYISSVWILSVSNHLPNHFGWGYARFNHVLRVCTIDMDTHSYGIYYGCLIFLGIIITFRYYWKMYRRLRSTTLPSQMVSGGNLNNPEKKLLGEILIWKTAFKVFVSYMVCWVPVAVMCIVGIRDTIPMPVYLTAGLLAHCNSTLNFFVYIVYNAKFRTQLMSMFGRKNDYAVKKNAWENPNVLCVAPAVVK